MKLRLLALLLLFNIPLFSQNCVRAGWVKKYGVSGTERIDKMCSDNGRLSFTVAGFFESTMTLGSTTITSPTGRGYYIARFDTAGNPLMLGLLGYATAASGVYIDVRQIETDNAGNVYVAGMCGGNSVTVQSTTFNYTTFGIMFVAKYDPNGAPLWVRSVTNGHQSSALGIAVDGAGNSYITGGFEGPSLVFDNDTLYNFNTAQNTYRDGYVAALDPNGQFIWAERFGTLQGDAGYSIALDGMGNLFVTGNLDFGNAYFSPVAGVNTIRQDWNFFVAKYTTAGAAQWVRTVDSYGTASHMYSYQAECDDAGSLYVTGEFNGTYGFGNSMVAVSYTASDDAFLAKFRPDGVCAWVKVGGGSNGDRAYAMDYYQGKIAWCGDIFSNNPVFGNLTVPVPGTNTFTAVTDTAGNMLWARVYCASISEVASGSFIDASGTVYTSGAFVQSETWYPVTIAPLGAADGYVVKFKVTSSAVPAVNAGPDHTTSCSASVQLTGSSVTAGSTYQWQGPNAFISSTLSPSVNPGFTSSYTLTASYQGCINTDATLVTVSPNGVDADAGPDVSICSGDSVQLNATSTPAGSTYTWTPSFFGLSSTTIANPWAKPAQTTDYIVCAINGSCRDYDTVRVTVDPKPYLSIASAYTTCAGVPVTLTAGPSGPNYNWTPSTGLSSTTTYTTVATPATTQFYTVTATSAAGCSRTANVTFQVLNNNVAPTVTTQPANQTICGGNQITFSCAATGSASVIYRWEMNTGSGWAQVPAAAPYSGTLSAFLTINPVNAAMNGYQFRCKTYSSCSPITYTNAATLTVSPDPVITVHPPNRSICPANNTTMTVTVPGTGYTYQWQGDFGAGFVNLVNGPPYSGVTNATLTISNATAAMNGYQYRVIVTGCSPSASSTSNAGVLSVGQPPLIQTQPENDTNCIGGTTQFSVVQTGGTGYAWQYYNGSTWQFLTNTTPYSGVNTATLTITPLSPAQNGLPIRCRISGGCSTITYSDTVAVSVQPAAVITGSPSNVNTCTGANISFTASATNAVSYQWQENSGSGFVALANVAPYSGVTTAVLNISPVSAGMNGYQYRCAVTGSCASPVTSNAATLTIPASVTLSAGPDEDTACVNSAAVFSVTAVNALSYQWEENSGSGFVPLTNSGVYSGVNTAMLTISPVSAGMNNYQYRCVAGGNCSSSVVSASALLTVPASLSLTSGPEDDTACTNATSFAVTAVNALTYQWEENSGSGFVPLMNTAPYSGVNTAVLNISPLNSGMNGYQYRCVTSDYCSSITSSAALLTVPATLSVTAEPADVTTCANSSALFSVTAANALTYQWQENSGSGWIALSNAAPYSGVTTALLSVNPVTVSMNGYRYRCVMTGNCSAIITSDSAEIIFSSGVAVLSQPSSATVCENDVVTFTFASSGATGYQWEADFGSGFTPLSNSAMFAGVTTSQLTITGATSMQNGGIFRCILTGCTGNVTTASALLTVNPLPIVSLAPFSTVCINWTPVTLTGGSPAGGTYSGNAVSGGVFDPAAAGAGMHTITYTYADVNGCSDTAQQLINVDLCTGLSANAEPGAVQLFPNPATSSATLVLGQEGVNTICTIEVLSSQGQVLSAQQQTVNGRSNVEMGFRNFAKGVYFVRVISDNGIQTIRLVLI